ncbi:MAG: SDR family oxidoreductase [Acidobacteriota bacterium]|nr:SDR family oxidoreductase [Acidobacteriota bacterium]
MKFFVTGASGWIGSAVIPELLAAGHEVVGLARSDQSADRIRSAGAVPLAGTLDDTAGLAAAAADSDGVIHLAFNHEVAFEQGDFAAAASTDRRAVEAMGQALAGSDRPLVLASGVAGLAAGRPGVETDGLMPPEAIRGTPLMGRFTTSLFALSLAGTGVRSSVVRFAPTVHGQGDEGFMATFVAVARQKGVSGYVGDGTNGWSAVHVSDAARLVRLAAESAFPGAVLHATAEDSVAFRDIADAIGRRLGVSAASVSPDQAFDHFGFLGLFAGNDLSAASDATRQLLGWEPTGPTLLEDIEAGNYTN